MLYDSRISAARYLRGRFGSASTGCTGWPSAATDTWERKTPVIEGNNLDGIPLKTQRKSSPTKNRRNPGTNAVFHETPSLPRTTSRLNRARGRKSPPRGVLSVALRVPNPKFPTVENDPQSSRRAQAMRGVRVSWDISVSQFNLDRSSRCGQQGSRAYIQALVVELGATLEHSEGLRSRV